MKRIAILGYGILGFILFNLSLIYFIAFIANAPILPTKLDAESTGDLPTTILINLTLIALFGIQHSFMARPKFKQWWTKFIPAMIERTTYVICASLLILLLCAFWRPLPTILWEVKNPLLIWMLWGIFGLGWIFGMFASGLIDFFDLMGLRQVFAYFRNIPYIPPKFRVVSVYKYVRHPIMLGTLIGLWVMPYMTVGHLLLATGLSIYILIGIIYEERDLESILGKEYQAYRKSTPSLIPFLKR